jgi:hypothetical protein
MNRVGLPRTALGFPVDVGPIIFDFLDAETIMRAWVIDTHAAWEIRSWLRTRLGSHVSFCETCWTHIGDTTCSPCQLKHNRARVPSRRSWLTVTLDVWDHRLEPFLIEWFGCELTLVMNYRTTSRADCCALDLTCTNQVVFVSRKLGSCPLCLLTDTC